MREQKWDQMKMRGLRNGTRKETETEKEEKRRKEEVRKMRMDYLIVVLKNFFRCRERQSFFIYFFRNALYEALYPIDVNMSFLDLILINKITFETTRNRKNEFGGAYWKERRDIGKRER